MKTTIFKDFIRYVSLNICGTIGLTCYILADTFFIAQGMGSAGITALNLALPMFNFIFAFGLMLGTGGATKYTVLKARGRDEEADRVFTLAVEVGLMFGILFLVLGVGFARQITGFLGADPAVFALTEGYLWTIFWFSPFFIFNQVVGAFVRNDGAPRLAMAAMMAGSIFNIVFDYIFIFLMKMGMFGAALATGVSPVISLLFLSLHFLRKQNRMHFVRGRLSIRPLWEIGTLGVSAFINEMSGGLVIMTFNFAILGITGNLGVAAYGVVANLAIVAVCLFNGLAQGMQPLVSECYGRGQKEDQRRLLRYGLTTALVTSLLLYVGAWFGTDVLVGIFNREGDPALAALAGEGLRIYFAGFFFVGVNIVMTFYYTASERAVPAFILSAIRGFAVIIPAILLLSRLGGMTGTWLAYPAAEAVGTGFLLLLALADRKKAAGEKGRN